MTVREWIEDFWCNLSMIPTEYTMEDAVEDYAAFIANDWDIPEDLTAKDLYEVFNELIAKMEEENKNMMKASPIPH